MSSNYRTQNLSSNVTEPYTSQVARKFIPQLFTVLQAGRLHNSFVLASVGSIGLISSGQGYNSWLPYLLAWTLLFMGIYFLNDFFDSAIDTINKPWKPVPSKRISKNNLQVIGAASLLIGALLVVLSLKQANIDSLKGSVAVVLVTYLGIEYSRWMKKNCPIFGDMIISIVVGICFFLPWLAFSDANVNYLWGFPIYTLALLGREYLKDIEDFDADAVGQRQTLPHEYGQKTALLVSTSLICITVIFALVVAIYVEGGYRYIAFIPFSITSIYFAYRSNVSKSQSWMKPALLFTLMFDLVYWSWFSV